MAQATQDVFRAVNVAFEGERQAEQPQGAVPFIASKWEGAKPGYAWKKGPEGLGYYLDRPEVVEDATPVPAPKVPATATKDADELLEVGACVCIC